MSGCNISMMAKWANDGRVWANDTKMPDQHKYQEKWIFVSYKMRGKCIQLIMLSFNYFQLFFTLNDVCGNFITVLIIRLYKYTFLLSVHQNNNVII